MYSDPVIDEIRKYRDEYAARFNYDIKAILADLKLRHKESGRRKVSRPPKPVAHAIDHGSNEGS